MVVQTKMFHQKCISDHWDWIPEIIFCKMKIPTRTMANSMMVAQCPKRSTISISTCYLSAPILSQCNQELFNQFDSVGQTQQPHCHHHQNHGGACSATQHFGCQNLHHTHPCVWSCTLLMTTPLSPIPAPPIMCFTTTINCKCANSTLLLWPKSLPGQ